jgi:hypothetical protein
MVKLRRAAGASCFACVASGTMSIALTIEVQRFAFVGKVAGRVASRQARKILSMPKALRSVVSEPIGTGLPVAGLADNQIPPEGRRSENPRDRRRRPNRQSTTRKDNPMDSNEIAVDEFAGRDPPMILDGSFEGLLALGAASTDRDAVWRADPPASVSLAYRRAATLLSIYRSRIDFLDQSALECDLRTN